MAEQYQRPAALSGYTHADVVELQGLQRGLGHGNVLAFTQAALVNNSVSRDAAGVAHRR